MDKAPVAAAQKPGWLLLVPLVPTVMVLTGQIMLERDLVIWSLVLGCPVCGLLASVWVMTDRSPRPWRATMALAAGILVTVASAVVAVVGCGVSGDPVRAFRFQ